MALHLPARFSVRADPDRDAIFVTLGGFFTPADVAAFSDAWWAAQTELRCGPNMHLTLCDIVDMNIQTQDVVNAFAEVVRHPTRHSRRMAMIVGVSLARLQAKRLPQPERRDVAYFYDRAEAERWLFSDARTDAQYPHAPASPTWDAHDCTGRSAA